MRIPSAIASFVASSASSQRAALARRPAAERIREPIAAWVAVHRWTLVVYGAMAVWSLALFVKVRSDHDGFRTLRFDFGNMVQAVWNTAHGHPLETTLASGEQVERLASHVDPILALLAPFWLVAPTPLTLAAVQIAAVATGALPVYWLGRRHLGSDAAAACMGLIYLSYPWLAWTAADPMHPVTLAIPLLLFAVWFLDTDRIVAFAVVAVLAALTGELMGLTVAALGIWYAVAYRRWRPGLAIATLGAGWTIVAVKVVIPAFSGGPSVYYSRYSEVGGSPEGVLRTAVTDPMAILSALTSRDDLLYLFWLVVPLAGVFLLAPGLAAVAVPQLLVNGLADRAAMIDPRFHYVAGIIPLFVAAAVFGLRRASPRSPLRGVAIVLLVLLVSTTALLVAGPGPWSPVEQKIARERTLPRGHVEALHEAVAVVPDRAPVTATNALGAHLSDRRYFYSVPVVGRAEWAVIDMRNAWMPEGPRGETIYPRRLAAFRDLLERSSAWTKVFERGDVVVFRKLNPE